MDPNVKQVKVDNWGIYFLQRLKHFFNRTDYCDLTLQFQDNAQLKVHRLVLSACTEYFELLERTCEMYEDCLVMPDDLQADVVVPIVNFMYTGQLEFHNDSLERLHQTSQVMNMPVLTKLLEAHRNQSKQASMKPKQVMNYAPPKRPAKSAELFKMGPKPSTSSSSSQPTKRNFSKAFATTPTQSEPENGPYISSTPIILAPAVAQKRVKVREAGEPRPTRYDLPEELDGNIFEDSFSHISYTSEPIMVHPETRKKYPSKKPVSTRFAEASCSKKTALSDIMESKRIKNQNMFEDELPTDLLSEQTEMFQPLHVKKEKNIMSENIFDQMMEIPVAHCEDSPSKSTPKVTIENSSPNNSGQGNIDHARIISEVLKKYPHLMKSNKNIKLKILNTSETAPVPKKKQPPAKKTDWHVKSEQQDNHPYQSVLDSQEAARLIAMGIENVKGPWICLMCGTPGQALHFPSYYKFRRHLVDIHKEKAALNVCEYCGLKSTKRNYMLHHMYTKHGVEPPRAFHFPKCSHCSYIALSEALLVKHKMGHQLDSRSFRCNICPATFNSSFQLLTHIRATGHKYSSEKRTNLQCIYCLKVFLRESNLYAHIKSNHKGLAVQDGIIDNSDEEESSQEHEQPLVKFEPPTYDEYEDSDNSNQLQQYEIRPDGNIELVHKKSQVANASKKQKILNSGFGKELSKPTRSGATYGKQVTKPVKQKPVNKVTNEEFLPEVNLSSNLAEPHEEIVVIDNNEYILRDNQLILRQKDSNEKFILGDVHHGTEEIRPPTEFVHIPAADENVGQNDKIANLNQNLIVVSNEEEYKALMNSNHSIIFDGNESNKTLTVLSTPHGATLSANVESDHSQNEMMIIQDNYPLNVSQAMPVDNNIMVVYTHQDKPYQIITSQGLGSQYIQSSAVMTQNCEAIDESTPVVTDHQVLIEAQQVESWQANITTNEQIEGNLAIAEEAGNASEDSMVANPELIVPELSGENSGEQNIAENTGQFIEEQTEAETEMSMCVDESAEPTIAQPEEQQRQESYPADDMQITQLTEEVEEPEEQQHDVLEQNSSETDIQHSNEEQVHEEQVHEEQVENQETAENHIVNDPESSDPAETVNDVSYDENTEGQDQDDSLEDAQNTLNNKTSQLNKPVEHLADEWSEDEYDTNQDITTVAQETEIQNEPGPQEEVEESIENIQQEMEKQMDPENAEAEDAESEDEATVQEEDTTINNAPKGQDPPEKISSLLNDWEDNDSQDDSANGNEEEAETPGLDETEESETIPKEGTDSVLVPAKIDKLKSLVSDWDEDDEDKN